VRAGLDGALADFRDSRYGRLSATLPRLISAGHVLAAGGGDSGQRDALLAGIYTLTTRMLIKLDDQQLGRMAADRARVARLGRLAGLLVLLYAQPVARVARLTTSHVRHRQRCHSADLRRHGADHAARAGRQPGPAATGRQARTRHYRCRRSIALAVSRRPAWPPGQLRPPRAEPERPRHPPRPGTLDGTVPAGHRASRRPAGPHARHPHRGRHRLAADLRR